MNIKPLGDQVFLRLVEENTNAYGLIISDDRRNRAYTCEVVAVGSGLVHTSGKVIPLDIETGNRILVDKGDVKVVTLEGIDYLVTTGSKIMAVFG